MPYEGWYKSIYMQSAHYFHDMSSDKFYSLCSKATTASHHACFFKETYEPHTPCPQCLARLQRIQAREHK